MTVSRSTSVFMHHVPLHMVGGLLLKGPGEPSLVYALKFRFNDANLLCHMSAQYTS